MSVIADKIEKFILNKLTEEQERLILKRNELADELDCAPSQISYVLSTRFSNERGFDVESRRGLGGYIRIRKLQPESSNMVPAVTTYHIYEGPNRVERLIDYSQSLCIHDRDIAEGVMSYEMRSLPYK